MAKRKASKKTAKRKPFIGRTATTIIHLPVDYPTDELSLLCAAVRQFDDKGRELVDTLYQAIAKGDARHVAKLGILIGNRNYAIVNGPNEPYVRRGQQFTNNEPKGAAIPKLPPPKIAKAREIFDQEKARGVSDTAAYKRTADKLNKNRQKKSRVSLDTIKRALKPQ